VLIAKSLGKNFLDKSINSLLQIRFKYRSALGISLNGSPDSAK
jgi:hypothetical protein